MADISCPYLFTRGDAGCFRVCVGGRAAMKGVEHGILVHKVHLRCGLPRGTPYLCTGCHIGHCSVRWSVQGTRQRH